MLVLLMGLFMKYAVEVRSGAMTYVPSFIKMIQLFKSTVEVFSLMLSSTACDSLWMSDTVSKRHPFSFIFSLRNIAKSGE
jgi:uncharacterized YccA/Bax inhibitor family protein